MVGSVTLGDKYAGDHVTVGIPVSVCAVENGVSGSRAGLGLSASTPPLLAAAVVGCLLLFVLCCWLRHQSFVHARKGSAAELHLKPMAACFGVAVFSCIAACPNPRAHVAALLWVAVCPRVLEY